MGMMIASEVQERAAATPVPSGADDAAAKLNARLCARPLLIAAPLYRRPELVRRLLDSLLACREEITALQAEVVLYNDSPADEGLAQALEAAIPLFTGALPLRVEVNPANLGFVRTANRAIAEAVARGYDLLLLNSDTVVTPGALGEMARVALADPMIGFVNPRSNNATLATLPYQDGYRFLAPKEAHAAWAAVSPRLPPYSYAPTANGFCMLIRWIVLAEFGGFDEIYGRGYNEENDLAMRAGRRGYRAVLANHAFVWHEGSVSFGRDHDALERTNRAILLKRYPEYPALTQAYFSSPEQRAELLLGALIPDADGRVDVALDFSSFVPAHNGTMLAGLQLLAKAQARWGDRFNPFVLCAEDTYAFHDMARFGAPRRDPHGPETFAAVFRVGQPYDWGAAHRLALKAASFGVFMLDTISQDCSGLYDPEVHKLWSWTAQNADFVAATSEMTHGQLSRRFSFGPQVRRVRSLHSLDLADYALPPPRAQERWVEPGYILVLGNHYWHKDVTSTANALALACRQRRVVVLGGATVEPADEGRYAPEGLREAGNLYRIKAGALTDGEMSALYDGADVIVAPSHYEGFGMPLLNALAARRPVFVRPSPVVAELLAALGGDANVHSYLTTGELVERLAEPPAWDARGASPGRPGDAVRAADDIGRALDLAVANASYARIVRRLTSLTSHSADPPPAPAAATPQAFVAQRAAQAVERGLTRALALPGVFPVLRRSVRLARLLTGWRRHSP